MAEDHVAFASVAPSFPWGLFSLLFQYGFKYSLSFVNRCIMLVEVKFIVIVQISTIYTSIVYFVAKILIKVLLVTAIIVKAEGDIIYP